MAFLGETVGAVTLLTRKPFPFLILLWSLYPSKPGQAIPSALCHFKLAKTIYFLRFSSNSFFRAKSNSRERTITIMVHAIIPARSICILCRYIWAPMVFCVMKLKTSAVTMILKLSPSAERDPAAIKGFSDGI